MYEPQPIIKVKTSPIEHSEIFLKLIRVWRVTFLYHCNLRFFLYVKQWFFSWRLVSSYQTFICVWRKWFISRRWLWLLQVDSRFAVKQPLNVTNGLPKWRTSPPCPISTSLPLRNLLLESLLCWRSLVTNSLILLILFKDWQLLIFHIQTY